MRRIVLFTLLLGLIGHSEIAESAIKVGSKKFTGSVLLGDMVTHLSRHAGYESRHVRELGGTRILWNALLKGEIDVYPEYTGTIRHEILANQSITSATDLKNALAKVGIRMSDPIGFNNTYAMGVKRPLAAKLGLKTISDLGKYPKLRFGFSSEFLERADGWPGMRESYLLPHKMVTGLDHDLAYRGLAGGSLDVIDLYATDAEIPYYDLVTLEDDHHYFPAYQAVLLYRDKVTVTHPGVDAAFSQMQGLVDAATMAALNGRVKFEQVSSRVVAADYLKERLGIDLEVKDRSWVTTLLAHTREHLFLVGCSVLLAILIAVPLGILSAKKRAAGRVILTVVGLMQTIPSLALLVFMIPFLGIGTMPAMAALFLYGLLPIVRNTHQGLVGIPQHLEETARALGLSTAARLFQIELPLASGAIFAGIKTAAVINIGTATLGALVGAGGYGQPILTGIRLDNVSLILQGAIPAAVMALLTELLFEAFERKMFPHAHRG